MAGNGALPHNGGDRRADDGAGTPASLMDRLSKAFLKPPKPKPASGTAVPPEHVKPEVELTEAEKSARIRQVDPLERKMGYLGAALVAIVALLAFLPYVNNPNKTVSQTSDLLKGSCKSYGPSFKDTVVSGVHKCVGEVVYSRGHWVIEMLIVLFFAVGLFVATRVGRRSAVAFAALFAGLAVEGTTGSIIGIIFVFGGGWLLMRAWRVQRYGTTNAKEVRAIATERAKERRGAKSGPAAGGRWGRRAAAGSGASSASARRAPSPNKRYTPKTPRKRPPPPAD